MTRPSEVRVYSGPLLAIVTHMKHVLEMNGIESQVHGEYRAGAVGEIPVTDAWPELWVLNPAERERAGGLVAEALEQGESQLAEWKCRECQETVEGQFAECWNCGSGLPDA